MKAVFSKSFKRAYKALPGDIQAQVDKQLTALLDNPHHPSLQLKKMEGHQTIWEARISAGYRITFQINGDTYLLRRVGTHDVLRKP